MVDQSVPAGSLLWTGLCFAAIHHSECIHLLTITWIRYINDVWGMSGHNSECIHLLTITWIRYIRDVWGMSGHHYECIHSLQTVDESMRSLHGRISPVLGFGHVSAAAVLCAPLHRRMGTNAALNMNNVLNILIYSQTASPSSFF